MQTRSGILLWEMAAMWIGVFLLAGCAPGPGDATPVAGTRQPAIGPSTADEGDCVRGEPEPMLEGVPGRAKPRFWKTRKYEAIETYAVDDRVQLTIRHFGCSHYAQEFTFAMAQAASNGARAWMLRSAQLLDNLPVEQAHRKIVAEIAQLLRNQAKDDYRYGEPLALSETETVSCAVETNEGLAKLVILYDHAL